MVKLTFTFPRRSAERLNILFPRSLGRLIAGLAATLLLVGSRADAQSVAQQFAGADWFARPLGTGVTWKYYHFDNLFGAPQDICVIEANLNTPNVSVELPFRNGLLRTTKMITTDFPGAAGGINGTFFNVRGTSTYLRVNGTEPNRAETFGNWGYQGGLVFNRNNRIYKVVQRPKDTGGAAKAAEDWRSNANIYTDVMVNGPLLVQNGAIARGFYASLGSHCDTRHPRTMVGMKPGNVLVLVAADGRHPGRAAGLTCEEMAQVMFALGCSDALSLDGGGSTLMYGRGEPFNGILNYPSDNGGWDHDPADERAVANAIAVVAPAPNPLPFDARVEILSAPTSIRQGEVKWVQMKLTNIGAQPWNNGRISLATSRPAKHTSAFYSSTNWPNLYAAWRLPAGSSVAPNQSLTIFFQLKGPEIATAGKLSEMFQLRVDDAYRIGPPDDEIKLTLDVTPGGNSFLVEPRTGGQNFAWYCDNGMADSPVNCLAPGATSNIGMRYGSTYRSVVGAKSASWLPSFPMRGFYRVKVA